MVNVPFTISAWFLWCTDFSIPKMDSRPLTGKTMQKSTDGFTSIHSENTDTHQKKKGKRNQQQK